MRRVAAWGRNSWRALTSMGTALAVWRNEPERMAGTATTVALTTSLAVYAACYLGAPALAGALGVPSAASVIRVMALSVVVSGLVTAPRAMVQRRAPRTRVLIEQARALFTFLRAVAEGDQSAYTRIPEDFARLRKLAGDSPQAAAFAEHVTEVVGLYRTLAAGGDIVPGLAEVRRKAARTLPADSALLGELDAVVDTVGTLSMQGSGTADEQLAAAAGGPGAQVAAQASR